MTLWFCKHAHVVLYVYKLYFLSDKQLGAEFLGHTMNVYLHL